MTGAVIGRSSILVQRFTPAARAGRHKGVIDTKPRAWLRHAGQGDTLNMTDAPFIRDLDLRGLKCPMPVFRTRRALSTLQAGVRLDVLCTDSLAVIDIPNLLRETGDTLLASTGEAGIWRFIILKE